MIGSIQTNEKCPICGEAFKHIENIGLKCLKHPDQHPKRIRVYFKSTSKRFPYKYYEQAIRFLNGLRYKHDEGSYDPRDYQKDNPLGFENLIDSWLENKKKEVSGGYYIHLVNYAEKAKYFFQNRNIKDIEYGDIEDFRNSLTVGNKTKHNIITALHAFWVWVWKRNKKTFSVADFPDFPEVKYELGYRRTVSKDIQWDILDELKRISFHRNPKIYYGIKWLCTYVKVRPAEMLSLKEGDIDGEMDISFFLIPKRTNTKK